MDEEELTEYDIAQIRMHEDLESVDTEKLDYCYGAVTGTREMDSEDSIHGVEAEGKILMQKTVREYITIVARYHGSAEAAHIAAQYANMRWPKMAKAFGGAKTSFYTRSRSGTSFMDLSCPYDGVENAAKGCETAYANALEGQFVGTR